VAAPTDPFSSLSRRQRWLLRRQLTRAWQLGRSEQRAVTLAAARATAVGAPVQGVQTDPAPPGLTALLTSSELTFSGGTTLRLGCCYAPAVQQLAVAVAQGPVVLARMAHHGRCWGLYFRSGFGWLPVLAVSARVAPDGGGLRRTPDRLTPTGA
jgi:hypothetical protein